MQTLHSIFLSTKLLLKLSASVLVLASMVACGGNPYVDDADRDDVITIGDSIFDLSGDIQTYLEQEAGQTFRNYTQSGAMLSGGILATAIDQQYADANGANGDISTVVMNGGGNDILIPAILLDPYGCRTHWWRWNISRSCKNLVNNSYVTAVNLMNDMAADGVDDIVFLGYYTLPRSNANLEKAVNYGDKRLGDACANTVANCSFIDPRGTVPAEHVLGDNIHPTSEGSRTLANQIWPLLEPLL
jgi:lysophospholipase L1-like esterase